MGTQTDFAMFSLERTKHISCHEGGILITGNEKYATKARKFGGGGFKILLQTKVSLPQLYHLNFNRLILRGMMH